MSERIEKPDSEWKKELTDEQYAVLREHATEPPGSSPLNREKRQGDFLCAGCHAKLFGSQTKFESGSGWPSFFAPEKDAVATTIDRSHMMTRVWVEIWILSSRPRDIQSEHGYRFHLYLKHG